MNISFHPSICRPDKPEWYARGYKIRPLDRFESLEEHAQVFVWSPIIWSEGKRQRDAFSSASLVALDFDDPGFGIADAAAWLHQRGYSYIIGLTKSHMKPKISGKSVKPPCERFRVLIPAQPIRDRDAYEWNMEQIMREVPADKSCTDAARYFFPCASIHSSFFGGVEFQWRELPHDYETAEERLAKGRERIANYAQKSCLPRWVLNSLANGHSVGGRHKRVYALGIALTHFGLSESEIFRKVMASPLSEIGAAHVEYCIACGVKKACQERGGADASIHTLHESRVGDGRRRSERNAEVSAEISSSGTESR